ncbi:glycosyltransferase family 4 protein [uncultured Winogradskyella sp.]|uniref:glycosyltransferase family 4 protein n=1 Tax=uncultured Winogradskyella sp. TaxID=395353 RepID=UPI00262EF3E7|nr:glycosyltransferase family 4 protein [uncultured Winogradskyella sp.]
MIKVIQIIDALEAGGAERLAVNYANGLAKLGIASHLCTTRAEGSLVNTIDKDVGYLFLKKTAKLDGVAILKLRRYIKQHQIDIIHAHSSSFFISTIVKIVVPSVKIIWHDHYGKSETVAKRPKRVLRFCSRFFSYIFSVNTTLKLWSKDNLHCNNVEFIRNFPVLVTNKSEVTKLKGYKGKRILCLANLRSQKDHLLLLEAFKLVHQKFPEWSLHCVGKDFKDAYSHRYFQKIDDLGLSKHVYFYDSRNDILNIMQQCQIGVLSSKSEGLPLALLEYGFAKLPVIVTNVGSCGDVINNENLGQLIASGDVENFAKAILRYIKDDDYRLSCAKHFNKRVEDVYSETSILNDVVEIYQKLL